MWGGLVNEIQYLQVGVTNLKFRNIIFYKKDENKKDEAPTHLELNWIILLH